MTAWLAALLACAGLIAAYAGSAITTTVERLDDSESVRADTLLRERALGGTPQLPNETLIVRSAALSVDDAAYRAHVEAIAAQLLGLGPEVVSWGASYYLSGDEALVSADRRSTLIPLVLRRPREDIARVREAARAASTDGRFELYSVGRASIGADYAALARDDLKAEVRIGLPAAIAVLLVVFGSVIAALLPVLVALAAIGVALAATALIGQLSPVYFLATNMIVMMGLALGIDYSLFILSRYREERRAGRDKLDAIDAAGRSAARAVLYSGATVVLALAGLLLVPTNVFRSLGTGAILVTATAVLASFTLLPAMIGLLGDRLEALRVPLPRMPGAARRRGFWDGVTATVMRWPLASFAVAAALLLAAAAPTLRMNAGFAGVETLPERLESRQGFRILQRDFHYGVLSVTRIVVDGDLGAPATRAALGALRAALAADAKFLAAGSTLRADAAGRTAVLAVPMAGDAEDGAVQEAVRRLRQDTIPRLFADAPARVLVAGNAAGYIDFFALTADYTPRVFAFVLGTSFLLLLAVFRSIAVPLVAIALNLLSVGAAYGLMVAVFQLGIGADLLGFRPAEAIEAWIPLFLFAVLFGLSMDYHVFLLSRIRERFEQTRRNDDAVAFGLQRSAGIITGAALIMVAIFAGFASGELVMFQQAGFGLAVAVLLDATLVRAVLVPSAMSLLGERNWALPRWLEWLPRL
ncbi:MAG TPA: MMPL family transporter [Burkholderiales bacterium]|nr:MMPL family transporter [Burkholderiales bacterium]